MIEMADQPRIHIVPVIFLTKVYFGRIAIHNPRHCAWTKVTLESVCGRLKIHVWHCNVMHFDAVTRALHGVHWRSRLRDGRSVLCEARRAVPLWKHRQQHPRRRRTQPGPGNEGSSKELQGYLRGTL